MKKYSARGAITVFLSLCSVLFIALIGTLAESARVQGARARAAAVTDIGLFSLFGEYEKEVMEQFQVFFLDGSYGSGDFSGERIAFRLRQFIEKNLKPPQKSFGSSGLQLFPLQLEGVTVRRFALATDGNGAAFYQQVVQNTKAGLGIDIIADYMNNQKEAQDQSEKAENYREQEQQNEQQIEQQLEAGEHAEAEETEPQSGDEPEQVKVENPLEALNEIRKKGILELVVKDSQKLSDKKADRKKLASGRRRNQGNMEVKTKAGGIAADGIFYEYLQRRLSCMTNKRLPGELDYQLEYVLAGKDSDIDNLKAVVHRLLLLREGVNFAYAVSNSEMRNQAEVLGTAIAAAFGLPQLGKPLGTALLLGWAYGESLLDVRILLAGGRVALTKTREDWKLSLENLGRLGEVLEQCDKGEGSGQTYQDYLRILYFLGSKTDYPLRTLDIIEGIIRLSGNPRAQADQWVVAAQAETDWYMEPVFLSIPAAFMGLNEQGSGYSVQGGFAY